MLHTVCKVGFIYCNHEVALKQFQNKEETIQHKLLKRLIKL